MSRPAGIRTPQRIRALTYLRECIATGRPLSITRMVEIGAGADRWSAKRCLRWAAEQLRCEHG